MFSLLPFNDFFDDDILKNNIFVMLSTLITNNTSRHHGHAMEQCFE